MRRGRWIATAGAVGLVGLGLAVRAGAGVEATAPEGIGEVLCLRKAALDLTERGPTAEEVADLQAGRTTLGTLVDGYLATPEFSQVVFDWYRRQFPPTTTSPAGLDYDEPARIARHVVVEDRDYREILTGRYTVDALGSEVAVTEHPAAGVLTTAHYMSAYFGLLRRNWAGHYLSEWGGIVLQAVTVPADMPVDTSREGLAANPSCAGCHVNAVYGVDFLARFADCFREDGTWDAACADPTDASYLTEAGSGVEALARVTVGSREFESQAVGFFFKQLFGRPLAHQDAAFYVEAARAFEASGYRAKALVKQLVTSPGYCAR